MTREIKVQNRTDTRNIGAGQDRHVEYGCETERTCGIRTQYMTVIWNTQYRTDVRNTNTIPDSFWNTQAMQDRRVER